jgi:hypothetical protein
MRDGKLVKIFENHEEILNLARGTERVADKIVK